MKWIHILAAILVALIWGLNFVVIKIGLEVFPPLLFSALRFAVAALPALVLVRRNGLSWRWIVGIGLVMGVASNGLLFVGMSYGIPAGLSSLVMQTHVIFTLMLSWVLLQDRAGWRQMLGVALAFGGIGLLACQMHPGATFLGLVLALGAAVAFAVSTILLKLVGRVEMLRLTLWVSLVPPLPLLAMSLALEHGQWQAIRQISWPGVGALLYTGVISTILAFAIWGKLVKTYSPSAVAPYGLLVPVFGLLSATVFLGEHYGPAKLAACGVVALGLLIAVFDKRAPEAIDGR